MESIKNILPKIIKQAGISRQVEASLIVNAFAEVVEKVVSPLAAKKAQALYYKDKTLTVACLSSVISQELQLNQKKILRGVNAKFDRELVEKIRFLT